MCNLEVVVPQKYEEGRHRNDCKEWMKAYKQELENMTKVAKMTLVPETEAKEVILLKEIFTKKYDDIE